MPRWSAVVLACACLLIAACAPKAAPTPTPPEPTHRLRFSVLWGYDNVTISGLAIVDAAGGELDREPDRDALTCTLHQGKAIFANLPLEPG